MAVEELRPLGDDGLLFLWQQILGQFVKKQEGKGLSTNDLTNALLEKINNSGTSNFDGNYNSLSNQPQINGIALTGNKTFDDLGITQAINSAIGNVTQIAFEVLSSVEDLPSTGSKGVFYLVPNTGNSNNNYDEYIWVSSKNSYEIIGQIQKEIDLSGYVKYTDIVPLTNDEILQIINSATV